MWRTGADLRERGRQGSEHNDSDVRVFLNKKTPQELKERLANLEGHKLSDNGEFDPGSGRTLAACFIHASRTRISSLLGRKVADG